MKRIATILMILLLCTAVAQAQKVRGNVYGGGNKGAVGGNTTVTVYSGDVNNTFGGARMANVGGRTFVNIDGEHASDNITISSVYGGNDIAGTIGQSGEETSVPAELQNVRSEKTEDEITASGLTREEYNKKTNLIDNSWKTFVATSRSTKVADSKTVEDKWITIGSLFGGGNGEYQYEEDDASGTDTKKAYNVYQIPKNTGDAPIATITVDKDKTYLPELDKTYLEIKGGNIAHVYGGGNNATVKVNTTINIDNESEDCDKFITAYATATGRTKEEVFGILKTMAKLSTFQSSITSFEFNHARVFGGNNKAEMAIRPTWNLQQGIIRDLYSGGNQGTMTSPEGLLLEIDPLSNNPNPLIVENVYGGCRMADVEPRVNGVYTPTSNLPGYNFPNELSARVLIRGGDINNVYGGNDVTGTVYGGNAIGIYTSIRGDVYGGGNGAYAYTDKKDGDDYSDFFYGSDTDINDLNAFRPNAEQVSIRLMGKGPNPEDFTIIKGSVYLGGNCATLDTKKSNPLVELKLGSYVIADKVFLGNNGTKMVDENILKLYADSYEGVGEYSSLDLTDPTTFDNYMEGVAMDLQPKIVFDAKYVDNSSYIGSFYCGGNVGSMAIPGKNTYKIDRRLNIFEKFVGGCNNANVAAQDGLNAAYEGGVLGADNERPDFLDNAGKPKDRLQIDLENLTITPLRWNDDKTMLIWNTNKWDDNEKGFVPVENSPVDDNTRLLGGNVYGGCYNSGHVNGNVIININEDVLKKDEVFGSGTGSNGREKSGVDFENQRNDVMAVALSVFGAGCGEDTEIWGSTAVNLNNGYAFQIYGGGEEGVVGKKINKYDAESGVFIGKEYVFNPAYSSTVNLNGSQPIYSSDGTSQSLAETEFIYGGGNEGDVCGNTYVNLGNGRVYDAFGGASDADILGHTELYIGRQPNGSGGYKDGFPWIKDIVYGGNDFGGTIHGEYEDGFNYISRIRNYAADGGSLHRNPTNAEPGVLKSASYVEYLQGRVDTIFGGNYGYYNYALEKYEGSEMPYLPNSFVNIRPNTNGQNAIKGIFGGGTGYPKNRDGDKSQDQSYVLIDIPDGVEKYAAVDVFGSGSYNGLGMRFRKADTFEDNFNPDQLSAIVDLIHGKIDAVYGGSFNEGITARTVVNVPAASTIKVGDIFGGAYGTQILPPCDVYESNVNYRNTSEEARVSGSIYGGNNNERRTLYAKVNISSPVWSNKEKGYLATVYGAGKGLDTWSEYTEVNLENGAKVYEVYGGGEMGHVLNAESVQKYMQLYKDGPSNQIATDDPYWKDSSKWTLTNGVHIPNTAELKARWAADWADAWTMGDYYEPTTDFNTYATNGWTNLTNSALVTHDADMDDRDFTGYAEEDKARVFKKYNANVRIHEGATVVGYAYGGGLGDKDLALSGDVYGTTYIALLGGTVQKDIYAAGTTGAVYDLFGVGAYATNNTTGFTASANAYVKGGSCRNVYGGGWKGDVGLHSGNLSDSSSGDVLGETHVVIGDVAGSTFTSGLPTVQRNAYGGGEGGAVFGMAHLTMYNGYVGYQYDGSNYVEKIEDDTKTTPNTLLKDAGCLFGGGYIDNSTVDKTRVKLYGGSVRGSVFGGGEIAAIGRGSISKTTVDGKTKYSLAGLYRPGKTNIEIFGGHVYRNVFGGGRGTDNLGGHGSFNSDGYVFGQTEVHIHGGEIGSVSAVAEGNGNVFGGGDEGFVYSALEENGTFYKGVKIGERYGTDDHQGYYFKHEWADNGIFIRDGSENIFTEDCKVLVEPHLKVKSAVTINGHDYTAGQYVPIEDLNTLGNKTTDAARWECLDEAGIIIHNAVFAGGNTPSGSLSTNANTASVFGNATASVNDIFHRDMITLGTRHTGGLYGDGNLTLVDGYRELNITNYGTDYYSIAKSIDIDAYHALPDREADYYELKYTCLIDCKDKEGTQYRKKTTDENGATTNASTITADEMQTLFVVDVTDAQGNIVMENGKPKKQSVKDGSTDILIYNAETGEWVPNPNGGNPYWEESGVLPVYAGRLMNSIQRSDFCGVWGSRMVMQGAQDRVPEEVDYTNYTINRVREVSLNKKTSTAGDNVVHGNYFGIYNIVNYLGALTSDVDFGDDTNRPYARTTDNSDEAKYKCEANGKAYGTASFYDWKKQFSTDRKRNNGNSHNKVALASGVYLELTTEESTGNGLYEKDWGPITGVIELDLINVSTGIGGGFVYAKNQHGVRTKSGHKNTTLTALNRDAVTQWDYNYSETEDETNQMAWETSGNFVHSTQTIIDDCYNVSNRYMGEGKMPAHYWYIKGSVYVYDQYISAYTGVPNAYSETVDIPLTIAAASHGKMKLLDIMPNRYAYYASPGVKLEDNKKLVINEKTYYKNDPISYWDWYLLSKSEKELFVEKTFVNCITCKIDGTEYEAGTYVMTDAEFTAYKNSNHTFTNADGETILDADKNAADADYIFRSSNIVSHDTGYILTYELNNPSQWDNWYTLKSGNYRDKKTLAEYEAMDVNTRANYYDGPTYRLKNEYTEGMLLGQRSYKVGELIAKSIEVTYQDIKTNYSTAIPTDDDHKQAEFEEAYIVPNKITVTEGTSERHYNPGTAVDKTFAQSQNIASDDNKAYVCTKTIQVTKEDVIYKDSKMKKSEADAYISDVNGKMNAIKTGASDLTTDAIKALATTESFTAENKKTLTELAIVRDELKTNLVQAYYCKTAGLYGGNYFVSGQNYRGLEAWSSLTAADHTKFDYNYDALDVLIDPNYSGREGQKYQYDGNYTSEEAVRDATNGNKAGYSVPQSVDYTASYNGKDADPTETAEGVNNGKKYMTAATTIVPSGKVYVGDELTRDQYEALPNEQRHYAPIAVKAGTATYYVVNTAFQIGSTPYAVGETISGESFNGLPSAEQGNITTLSFTTTPTADQTIYYCRESYTPSVTTNTLSDISGAGTGAAGNLGTIIGKSQYDELPNQQRNFTIHGISPTETSTLYVSRESDIYDLSKEKIITVIYEYDYDETDGQGNVTPISERHVVNIHLMFKSGVPIVEDISAPDIILPGDYTTISEPDVTPGAYEVTGGGWELFESQRDAESHSNGVDYNPNDDPLYWYQDGYYVAYYAKSYAGRTYSNYVPVSVANYHDLANVMSDENKSHHMYIDNKNVKRAPKIYINDYSGSGKNGLDLFKNLYDLSLLTTPATSGALNGHALLNDRVKAGNNLEFFLRTDINHAGSWTPIASGENEPCFNGTFHGDGHTISGLTPAEGTTGSLFGKLCGNVYNLGVTGSFTGAGVADTGDGYVESCWVKSSATVNSNVMAVFGNLTRGGGDNKMQLVNCYYPKSNVYSEAANVHGNAIKMLDLAFYNGEVAYDLNNFYLNKRYYDSKGQTDGTMYHYFKPDANGELTNTTGYYPAFTSAVAQYGNIGYVEDRFADGDFRFAGGFIPDAEDERHWVATVTNTGGQTKEEDRWSPIWPDDYIFFGQKLTYGWAATHQEVPTAVVRDGGRLSLDANANRVYRAPAYYRNSTMGVAHFNPNAYLAAKSVDGTKDAYPGMTAIDFAGRDDTTIALGKSGSWFYPPLLDDEGLTGITNCDETRNLLVYAPAETANNGYANKKTCDVLNAYFIEPAFDTYYDNSDGYRIVGDAINEMSSIYGHLVQSNLKATNDHLLVDKEDFYAPFGYTFGADYRMWYQRTPENLEYVDRKKGWQGISLPFTAELVTTHQKGEITHFYSGSEASKNGTESKIGHEYWLREFNGGSFDPKDNTIYVASFTYPKAPNIGDTKNATNTFLWDYYYKGLAGGHNQKDDNDDTYQEYYRRLRTYERYAFLASGTPYLLGLPGVTYYEFDLSGNFVAQNTAATIGKLDKQILTFASETGTAIKASDSEMSGVTPAGSAYTFKPNYLNKTVSVDVNYTLKADGSSYDKVTGDATTVYAFRPFFTSGTANSRTRSIVFSDEKSDLKVDNEHGDPREDATGTLKVYVQKDKIYVESSLSYTTDVRVVTAAGVTVANFTVNPGQTREVQADFSGMYIVHTEDGRYTKKVTVVK